MKLIELHILQSFPVSCLNRDDVGAPKTAIFGGVTRARISSQCLKRAIRLYASDMQPELFGSNRSRLFSGQINKLLTEHLPDQAEALTKCAAHYLGKLDPKDNARVKTLIFLSLDEYKRLAKLLLDLPANDREELCEAVASISPEELEKSEAEVEADSEDTKEEKTSTKAKSKDKPLTATQFTKKVNSILKSPIKKEFGRGFVKDAADIAIFGRMVASDHSLTIEGAGLFSHALSTHKTENDIDFFSAVDDLQPREEAGAGMTGTLEFNSATYYRYAALNLDLLFCQKDNGGKRTATLGCLMGDDNHQTRRQIVEAFIRGVLLAVPSARKNSMNAHTLPGYVLGLVKEKGQPLQLINAFEKPVPFRDGVMEESIIRLKLHHEMLKKTWGIAPVLEVVIPDKTIEQFCEEILSHV
jgi:CRISPR system Cascade subunit CasC